MASKRNGDREPAAFAPEPESKRTARLSARAPSEWGAVRDAVAAARNLEALLRRPRVRMKTIVEVLPELREGARVLREAFTAAADRGEPASLVGARGLEHTGRMSSALDEVERGKSDRRAVAREVAEQGASLEACADMLALLSRADAPAPTELSVDRVVRETKRIVGQHGKDVAVRFDEAQPDCTVAADPYVLAPLLALLVARAEAEGVAAIVVRTRCAASAARLVVEAAGPGDAGLPVLTMRVTPWLSPSEAVVRRVAERVGATLDLSPGRAEVALAVAAG
jgi:hypothetical protein